MEEENLLDNLKLKDLWSKTYGDSRIRLALIDGTVDCSHPSLAGASLIQLDDWACATSSEGAASQHATHLASVILGQHDSLVLGIAPNCQGILIPIFRDGQDGSLIACSQADLALAMNRAVEQGVHLINISAGELSLSGIAEPILVEAVRNCVNAGILIVAAAGNQGCDCLNLPGALPSVLAVGAMDEYGNPIESSNWGEAYQNQGILAPGYKILGAKAGGGIINGSGTSCATAIVSGIAALLLSLQLKYGQNPDPLFIRQVLLESALKDEGDSRRFLAGRLHVEGALSLVKQRLNTSSGEVVYLPETPSPFGGLCVLAYWALRDRYKGVLSEKFGTVDIHLPNGDFYNVRDLHYFLGSRSIGMQLIPVSDDSDITTPDESQVPGHYFIDDFLRQEMALSTEEPIYALISYTRPDEHSIPLTQLMSTKKLQLGHQHLAAYIGEGNTTHALERFSNPDWKPKGRHIIWNVKGYPANVHIILLKGVEQRILNKNAQIVDIILTSEVLSPVNTQNIKCRTIDINTILQFYRDWIRDAEYLKDLSWYTNCSNHKSIVINVMLNVPHNKKRFQEIFGDDGLQLWQDFKAKYAQITESIFTEADETEFEPLWQLEGLIAESIRPLTLADYNTFQAAKLENRLDSYTDRQPLEPGKGMAWQLETLADLITGFMVMYVSFPDVGGIVPALMLQSLQTQVTGMLSISDEQYKDLVEPIIKKLILADAMVNAPNNPLWLRQATAKLYAGLEGNPDDLNLTGTADTSLMNQIENYLTDARENLDEILSGREMGVFEVADWLKQSLIPEVERARKMTVLDEKKSGFFSSPGIIQRIALKMYETSPFVTIRTVCTVMDSEELIIQNSSLSCRQQSVAENMPRNPKNATNFNEAGIIHTADVDSIRKEANPIVSNGTCMTNELESNLASQLRQSSPAMETVAVVPSALEPSACSCERSGEVVQLVYSLGKLDYDLVSQSRRDSIKQKMHDSANPENPEEFLAYLNSNPWDASAIQWTLNIDSTPIYVIQPQGAFAKDTYELLRQFFEEQFTEGVEMVSIPGFISGRVKLRSGYIVPVVVPEIRGMYSWTTAALVASLGGEPPSEEAPQEARESFLQVQEGAKNFLDRVYYELRNPGLAPQERAINFASTNAFEIERVYESVMREDMDLDTIEVERSPIGRPGTDCWDVKLYFFFPQRQVQTVRKAYRFTVDVTDVVPVTVGAVRSWFIR
jgi:PatG C-terminal/Subtilase family/PatG Domain